MLSCQYNSKSLEHDLEKISCTSSLEDINHKLNWISFIECNMYWCCEISIPIIGSSTMMISKKFAVRSLQWH